MPTEKPDCPTCRELPSSLKQTYLVMRYEILKYLRSRKLLGTIVIVLLITSLMYVLPFALGRPWAGHVTEQLDVRPFGGIFSYATLNHSDILDDTVTFSLNGTPIPGSQWNYTGSYDSVVFYSNLTGQNVTAGYDFRTPDRDFASFFLNFANFLIIICACFFASDALVSEYQNRTAYLIFPNPMRREALFFGKMFASFIACILMIGLFYLTVLVLSLATIGGAEFYLGLSFLFASLYMLAIVALAYLVSSLMKGSAGSIILTFFLMLMILPIVDSVGLFTGSKMWFSLSFNADVITSSLRWENYPQDGVSNFGPGLTIYDFHADPYVAVVVMVAYTVVLTLLSIFFFKRRQLTG